MFPLQLAIALKSDMHKCSLWKCFLEKKHLIIASAIFNENILQEKSIKSVIRLYRRWAQLRKKMSTPKQEIMGQKLLLCSAFSMVSRQCTNVWYIPFSFCIGYSCLSNATGQMQTCSNNGIRRRFFKLSKQYILFLYMLTVLSI